MQTVHITSVGELTSLLNQLPADILFRGQTSHFLKDGNPSVITSFDRKGCIPSQMLKWSRYAANMLETYIGRKAKLEFTQALLQHYGWRSFYVDCSSSAAVAAWFAAHTYSDKDLIELCEDCEERAIMLVKKRANYSFVDGEGHLYVFDKSLANRHVGAIDLDALRVQGARPRTTAQHAWLLGPLRNTEVAIECFLAHVIAPRSVFRDFAAANGFSETDNLFPSTQTDPILRALLGLPWKETKRADAELNMPIFRRALELPEYHDSFTKIASPAIAFFRGARIADRGEIEGARYGGIAIPVPEIVLFGVADPAPLRFPKITELLTKHRSVVFEIDDIIQHANMKGTVVYQKGVALQAHEPHLIELSELMVEHPGLEITAFGLNFGWYYRVNADAEWVRETHPDQCPCGSDDVHMRHLSALHIAEHFLATPASFE